MPGARRAARIATGDLPRHPAGPVASGLPERSHRPTPVPAGPQTCRIRKAHQMTSTANLPEPTADDGERSGFDIAGHAVGEGFTLIAGPCTAESREQTLTVADVAAAEGAAM